MAKIIDMRGRGGTGRGNTPPKKSHRETERQRQDAVEALELVNPVFVYFAAERLVARDADPFSGTDTEPNVLRIPLGDLLAAKRAFPAYECAVDQEKGEVVITLHPAPEQPTDEG